MTTNTPAPLVQEIAYYEANKEHMVAHHEGKYVVILGEVFLDAFDSLSNAYNAGVENFGEQQFLLRKVTRIETKPFNPAYTNGLLRAHL